MKNFTVSVVIPNLNGEKLLEKNLPSLFLAKDNPENRILEIIIVDDGSSDGSVKLITSKFSQIKLIKHKTNRGFSASVNTGVRAAKGDLILLINTDVIPAEDFLIPVFKHFENNKVFAVSLHEKEFGWAKGSFFDGYIQLAMGKESVEPHSSLYVSGGSGVFRRGTWMELNGMDEKLLSPFYWEDIDICYRAAKRGYVNLWEPDGHVMHNHESTISKFTKSYVQRIRERNQLLVIWKNIHSPSLFRKHLMGVLRRTISHPGYLRIILMAVGRLGTALKGRKREIKLSKVSDEAIFSRF
ncbi:MAG: glycosyltransferase family 2 protein [Candidatus Woesebacteria bacterium]|nr:glycosyltransferase family 2 protein [Candidatus Woesebacteria bacterium]